MLKAITINVLSVANEASVARTTGIAGLVNGLFGDRREFEATRLVAAVTTLILAAVKA